MTLKELEEQSNKELRRTHTDLKSWIEMYWRAYPDLHPTIVSTSLVLESHEINKLIDKEIDNINHHLDCMRT